MYDDEDDEEEELHVDDDDDKPSVDVTTTSSSSVVFRPTALGPLDAGSRLAGRPPPPPLLPAQLSAGLWPVGLPLLHHQLQLRNALNSES